MNATLFDPNGKVIFSFESALTKTEQKLKQPVIRLAKKNLSPHGYGKFTKFIKHIWVDKSDNIHIEDLDNRFPFTQFSKDIKDFFDGEHKFDKSVDSLENLDKAMDVSMDYLKSGSMYVLFTKDFANIMGFVKLNFSSKKNSDSVFVQLLYVKPEYRRQGIATELLEYAENLGIDKGKEKMEIGVFRKNIPALNAYLKYGFEEDNATLKPLIDVVAGKNKII